MRCGLPVNDGFLKMTHLCREDLINHTSDELQTGTAEEKEWSRETDNKVLQEGTRIEDCERLATQQNGEKKWRQVIKVPLFDVSGSVSGMVGVRMDITERKLAEEKVRENQRLLEAVFEAIPVGIQVKDREGRYLMVNHAMASIYGSRPEKITGMTFAELGIGTEEQRAVVAEDDRKVLDLGERRTDGIHHRCVLPVDQHGFDASVIEDVLVVGRCQSIVERHEHGSDLGGAVEALEEMVRVRTEKTHPVALPYAEFK